MSCRRKLYSTGLGPVLGPSVFSCVCEIQENTKDSSENIQVSLDLLQFQITHCSQGQDLVKMKF